MFPSLDTVGRKPLPQRFLSSRNSLTVALGWLAITVIIGANLFKNYSAVPLSPLLREARQSYNTDFTKQEDTGLWTSVPLVRVGNACLYPDRWFYVQGLLTLPLDRRKTFCSGKDFDFRGTSYASRFRLRPPFRVIARLKPASAPTVVSAFFTYTDPLEGNAHFENDFEFPSNTFTRNVVWTNVYSPGSNPVKGSPLLISRKEDLASMFANYEIEVTGHETTWSIDGEVVRKKNVEVLAAAQQIVFNSWQSPIWDGVYDYSFYQTGGTSFAVASVEALELPLEATN